MSDAVKYFQKNGLQASKELVDMGFGFVSLVWAVSAKGGSNNTINNIRNG